MALKENDFIEIEYLAKVQDSGIIFDLTNEELAKQHGLYQEKHQYKPIVICLGKNDILKGLDEFLIGKEPGSSYTATLTPEQAFGKKQPGLIKLVPTSIFKKQQINPAPGLQVNMDGIIGIIKSVSGGRTIVDFNHPLSGKVIVYEIKVLRIITSPKEKMEGILGNLMDKFEVKVEDSKAIILSNLKEGPFKKELEKEIKERIPEIKEIAFEKLTSQK